MFLMTISIPVMFGFIRSVGADANVGGLFGCEAGKFNTELLQVQTGYFLVEVLWQTVNVHFIFFGEKFNLSQCLIGK